MIPTAMLPEPEFAPPQPPNRTGTSLSIQFKNGGQVSGLGSIGLINMQSVSRYCWATEMMSDAHFQCVVQVHRLTTQATDQHVKSLWYCA